MKPPRYMRSLPQLLRSKSAEFWPVLRSLAAEELERLAGDNCRLRKKLNAKVSGAGTASAGLPG